MGQPQREGRQLHGFFTPDGVADALAAYERFAVDGLAWSVTHKIEMYRKADIAFDSALNRDERFAAFEYIYDQLRRFWQVFRGASERWPAKQLFDVFEEQGRECSRSSPIDLVAIADGGDARPVAQLLYLLRGVKTLRSGYPAYMTISKFLHFFNPRLFPIYDTAVIENRVLTAFAPEWHGFDRQFNVPNLHFPTIYYLRYVCWLSSLLAPHAPAIMKQFADWTRGLEGIDDGAAARLESSYATAAEFIVIGAMAATREFHDTERASRVLSGHQ